MKSWQLAAMVGFCALPAFRATLRRHLRNAEEGADTALWLGSTRPSLADGGGIWLDRVLDPEHAFALTRKTPATADQLHDFLAAHAASINR